jgi:hypothetical protein
MVASDILLMLAAIAGILAMVSWVRVASSRSMREASHLDGTEKLAERANRRALSFALVATVLTVLLAVAAYLARSARAS